MKTSVDSILQLVDKFVSGLITRAQLELELKEALDEYQAVSKELVEQKKPHSLTLSEWLALSTPRRSY